jgi:hypothetical protein
LAWPLGCLYSPVQQETALPQGEELDFGGPFTQVPHAHAIHPAPPDEARRGERARACGLFFLLLTLDLRKWRELPYLSMATSTSISKVVLKSFHITPCSHE